MMKLYAFILAAGKGERFGGAKALAPWQGTTLLGNALSLMPDEADVAVVTGAHKLPLGDVHELHNQNWAGGMGTSIATGINAAIAAKADVALIVPVDQPFVTTAHLRKLAEMALSLNKCVLTQDTGVSGPPAAVPASCFAQLSQLNDGGLKTAITDYAVHEGTGMLRDVDTQADLQRYS